MSRRPDAVLVMTGYRQIHELLAGRRLFAGSQIPDLTEEERAAVRVVVVSGVTPLSAADMALYPNLGRIVVIGAGFDRLDAAAAAARRIEVVTGSGGNAADVADTAVAMVLALVRGLIANDARVRTGGWMRGQLTPGRAMSAVKVGVVGLGHIGRAAADRLAAFGCALAYTGPRRKPEVDLPYVESVVGLARRSDVLVVTALLDESTRGLISAEVIEALGPEGILVNVSRGGLVDEDALIAALKDGRLGGAGLDVFAEEPTPACRWQDVPNVLLSPHAASATHSALDALFVLAAKNVTDYLDRPV